MLYSYYYFHKKSIFLTLLFTTAYMFIGIPAIDTLAWFLTDHSIIVAQYTPTKVGVCVLVAICTAFGLSIMHA